MNLKLGTGKTSIIKTYLYKLPKEEFLINNLNFSAKTTASQTQETILSKLTRYLFRQFLFAEKLCLFIMYQKKILALKELHMDQPKTKQV